MRTAHGYITDKKKLILAACEKFTKTWREKGIFHCLMSLGVIVEV